MSSIQNKFDDIQSLIFDGHIKSTVKVKDNVIVLRTLNSSEEKFISDNFSSVDTSYGLLAIAETLKRSIYSINGCVIDKNDRAREDVLNWSRILIMNLFKTYLSLGDRVYKAAQLIDEFCESDISKVKWATVKNTNFSFLNEPNYLQQLWIYINEQNDEVEKYKKGWKFAEYVSDSICTFINPKAMKQILQQRAENEKDIAFEMLPEVEDVIENTASEKNEENVENNKKIENAADDLFEALKRRKGETKDQYNERINAAMLKSMQEDEFDRIARENDEFHFARKLRIKKENARRIKEYASQEHAKKPTALVEYDFPVGMEISSTIGDSEEAAERYASSQSDNKFFVNGVDYSEICSTKAYELLQNRDKIFNDVVHESDEETIKWIGFYIEFEEKIEIGLGGSSRDPNELIDRSKRAKTGTLKERRDAMIKSQNIDEMRIGD